MLLYFFCVKSGCSLLIRVLTSPSGLPFNGISPIVDQLELNFFENFAHKPITCNLEQRDFLFLSNKVTIEMKKFWSEIKFVCKLRPVK